MKKIVTGALALLLIAGSAAAQQRDAGKEPRRDKMEQLNLTADQKTKLEALRAARQKDWTEWKKADDITVKESQARRKELQQKWDAEMKAILTPEQQAQMAKMRPAHGKSTRQHRGAHPKMAQQHLNLTDAQQAKMKDLNAAFKTKREALRSNTTLSEAAKKEQLKALAQQHRKEVQTLLTPEQQQKMEALRKEHRNKAGK